MAITRYNQRTTFHNRNTNYLFSDIFKNRGVSGINQFRLGLLKYPTLEDLVDVEVKGVVWTAGQKYFKLAHKYYGSGEYWWVIAWFNATPLEADIQPGAVINIPEPLEFVLEAFGVV